MPGGERRELRRVDLGRGPDEVLEEPRRDRLLAKERREPLDRDAICAHRAKHGKVCVHVGVPVDPGADGVCGHDDFLESV